MRNAADLWGCKTLGMMQSPQGRDDVDIHMNEAMQHEYTPVFSQEFEWYNFAETPQTANEKQFKNLIPLTPGMFGYSILRSSLENAMESTLNVRV